LTPRGLEIGNEVRQRIGQDLGVPEAFPPGFQSREMALQVAEQESIARDVARATATEAARKANIEEREIRVKERIDAVDPDQDVSPLLRQLTFEALGEDVARLLGPTISGGDLKVLRDRMDDANADAGRPPNFKKIMQEIDLIIPFGTEPEPRAGAIEKLMAGIHSNPVVAVNEARGDTAIRNFAREFPSQFAAGVARGAFHESDRNAGSTENLQAVKHIPGDVANGLIGANEFAPDQLVSTSELVAMITTLAVTDDPEELQRIVEDRLVEISGFTGDVGGAGGLPPAIPGAGPFNPSNLRRIGAIGAGIAGKVAPHLAPTGAPSDRLPVPRPGAFVPAPSPVPSDVFPPQFSSTVIPDPGAFGPPAPRRSLVPGPIQDFADFRFQVPRTSGGPTPDQAATFELNRRAARRKKKKRK
jgi:hypothetical protein